MYFSRHNKRLYVLYEEFTGEIAADLGVTKEKNTVYKNVKKLFPNSP